MDKIEPCPNPWCKGDPKVHHDPDTGEWQGYCAECSVEAPVKATPNEAIAAWNKRDPAHHDAGAVASIVESRARKICERRGINPDDITDHVGPVCEWHHEAYHINEAIDALSKGPNNE